MRTRANNGARVVRLGVLGSLSAINSPIASIENIATAVLDPINASGEPFRFSQSKCAAHARNAGASNERNPATIPIPIAKTKALVINDSLQLSHLRRVVRLPVAFNSFQPLNLTRRPIDSVAIDYWTYFGIAAAFGIVIFTENKLKIGVGFLFGAIGDTIERNSMGIDVVVLKSVLKQSKRSVFVQGMGTRASLDCDW
jgi:hypothetical protein